VPTAVETASNFGSASGFGASGFPPGVWRQHQHHHLSQLPDATEDSGDCYFKTAQPIKEQAACQNKPNDGPPMALVKRLEKLSVSSS
jgi:hypothetical protein